MSYFSDNMIFPNHVIVETRNNIVEYNCVIIADSYVAYYNKRQCEMKLTAILTCNKNAASILLDISIFQPYFITSSAFHVFSLERARLLRFLFP